MRLTEKQYDFGMYLDKKWYMLTAKENLRVNDAVAGLDVSILQDNVLIPILGIGDIRTDKRIDFVGGIRGLGELEPIQQLFVQHAQAAIDSLAK